MQVKKIYLDNNLKNNSEITDSLVNRNIIFSEIKIENSLNSISKKEIKINEPLIIEYLTIYNISDEQISKLSNITADSPVIILFRNNEKINFEKFAHLRGIYFFETENFIANFSTYLEYVTFNYSQIVNSIEQINNLTCYKNLFDSINAGVITLNNEFEIVKQNHFLKVLFGSKTIKKLKDFINPEEYDDFIEHLVNFSQSSEKHMNMLVGANDIDENTMTLEINITKIHQFNSVFYLLVLTNVDDKLKRESEIANLIEEMQLNREIIEENASEQIMLNSKLYEQQEELKMLNASKDKFFSIIAHDLKTPFQSLLGYSDILSKDIADLDKSEIKLFAENLNESAHKLFKLLENLLHWSRIQRGVITYNPEEMDLYLLSELNADLIYTRAKEKGVIVKNRIKPGTTCYGDTNIINTILRNLLSNAIKFTPKAGTITLKSEIIDNDTFLYVSDTGVGMSKKDMDKIFRIDSHHTTPGTDNEEGTGLGLILCYELAHKNHGELYVESEVGKGTTFTLKIPARKFQTNN